MRILFLTKSAPVIGGVEQWLDDLVIGLRERGFECLVGLAQGAKYHNPEAYMAQHPVLPVTMLDGRTGSPAGRRLAVARAIEKFRPDVIVPVMLFDGLLVSAALKQAYGFAIVYPIHEHSVGVANDIRRFGPALDKTIPVDVLTQQISTSTNSKVPNTLIRCGVATATTRLMNVDESVFRVGYCGRLETVQKRALDMVEIWKHLRKIDDIELMIAGDGSERDNVLRGLAEVAPAHRVQYLGGLTQDQMYKEFYPSLHAILITSECETGPLVSFEAMMHHVVVVTSRFEGLDLGGIFRDGSNCLVFDVGESLKAAEAILRLRVSPSLRRRLASEAFEYVSADRTLGKMCDAWADMLREVKRETGASPVAWRDVVSLKERVIERLRRWSGRRFPHTAIRSEWPFYSN